MGVTFFFLTELQDESLDVITEVLLFLFLFSPAYISKGIAKRLSLVVIRGSQWGGGPFDG